MKINNFELIETALYPEFDLKITLKPSFRCNQNCWFCEEYDNTSHEWTLEECELVLDKLNTIPDDKKKLWIYFYGGEPTLSEHWEYLQYEIVRMFPNRELFIQTQTNMSIDSNRLKLFLTQMNECKGTNHTIDICGSYHLGKQTKEDYLKKMNICAENGALGLTFFNTDLLQKEKFFDEFFFLVKEHPKHIKLRFTEIGYGVQDTKQAKQYPLTDDLKSYEFNTLMKEYPELSKYFEEGFNFNVKIDGEESVMNFAEVSAQNVHKNFRLMKCQCGTKNIVIDHNLKVYHCNDDFKNNHNISDLEGLDLEAFNAKDVFCMNKACYDGLEFHKWKR